MLNFAPAVRSEAKARVALLGPTGAGKTLTALEWATILAGLGGKVAVIDTENASASLYADKYGFDTAPWWPPYDATKLTAAIGEAARTYDVVVLDSLTHFWAGDGGVLDIVDREAQRNRGNSYAGWKVGSPVWRGLLDALIFAPCHVVVTMRSKMDYLLTQGDNGRAKVEKVGMAPVARNDVEYEFTIVGELDHTHRFTVTKSRCSDLADQSAAAHQAGKLAEVLRDWLNSASPDDTASRRPEPPPDDTDKVTDAQIRKMQASFSGHGVSEREQKLAYIADVVGRAVASSKDLTKDEASRVIDALSQPVDDPALFDGAT